MSMHHQFIFPRYPHLPPPDWQALETRLLADGYVLEPRGDRVPRDDLMNLSHGLAQLVDSYVHCGDSRTTGDVVERYQAAGHLPAAVPVRHTDTMRETLALLADHGVVPDPRFVDDESSSWRSPHYCLGPAARDCLDTAGRTEYDADPVGLSLVLLAYEGPHPYVGVGENLDHPHVPGSDVPLEALPPFGSHVDFIGAVYENPAVQWRDPRDGREYHMFDLDWRFSLALGFRMIRIDSLTRESTESLALAIGHLVGQEMACSHRHL